tara:strand:+ start:7556 stop:8329 length:774 start_codon:yes stop_codon:yes gene_type:complete
MTAGKLERVDMIKNPKVSILIPTYNRPFFLPLVINNIMRQNYPHELLEVVIDDDGTIPLILPELVEEIKKKIHPIKLNYMYDSKGRRTIGQKRNYLVSRATHDILINMDDDEIYFDQYISYSYNEMIKNHAECVGCNQLMILYPFKDYTLRAFHCGDDKTKIHENSIMFSRKWFMNSPRYERVSLGEGGKLFSGDNSKVFITDITNCLIQVAWGGNTADKEYFLKDRFKLPYDFDLSIIDQLKPFFDNLKKNFKNMK